MFDTKKFEKDICDEYKRRYTSKKDAMMEPFVLLVCSRLVAIAFELSQKNNVTDDPS